MQNSKLFFKKPAFAFEDAFPLGAGKLGAMVYGGVSKERISLNYDELWSGVPRDEDKKGASEYYFKARQLAYERKYIEAQNILEKHFSTSFVQQYQPAGNLFLTRENSEYEEYGRTLDLSKATAQVNYKNNNIEFKKYRF